MWYATISWIINIFESLLDKQTGEFISSTVKYLALFSGFWLEQNIELFILINIYFANEKLEAQCQRARTLKTECLLLCMEEDKI